MINYFKKENIHKTLSHRYSPKRIGSKNGAYNLCSNCEKKGNIHYKIDLKYIPDIFQKDVAIST